MKTNRYYNSSHLLIAILLIAAFLRLNHINQPLSDAFSWRETSTAMMADNFYHRNWNIFCKLEQESSEFVIYRIISPEKVPISS
jgi:hypothetical protein